MTTLEDKILGEKTHYYCSSDEDDDDKRPTVQPPQNEQNQGSVIRSTANTGPKGVINDWREYKKLQAEARLDKEAQELKLMKKLCLTGATKAEDEQRKAEEELDAELLELMSDDILVEFQKKRVQEINQKLGKKSHFGGLIHLKNGQDFLDEIEKEQNSTVVVHIYEETVASCRTMNQCLEGMAKEMPTIKFCKILSSIAGVSISFKTNALPALLVYKKGQIIGNFVRITDEIGEDFFDSDVENFLIEQGMIVEKEIQFTAIACPN